MKNYEHVIFYVYLVIYINIFGEKENGRFGGILKLKRNLYFICFKFLCILVHNLIITLQLQD